MHVATRGNEETVHAGGGQALWVVVLMAIEAPNYYYATVKKENSHVCIIWPRWHTEVDLVPESNLYICMFLNVRNQFDDQF